MAEPGGDTSNFATTVGARKPVNILRSMTTEKTVTLIATQSKLTLSGGKSRLTLQTMPDDDFSTSHSSTKSSRNWCWDLRSANGARSWCQCGLAESDGMEASGLQNARARWLCFPQPTGSVL